MSRFGLFAFGTFLLLLSSMAQASTTKKEGIFQLAPSDFQRLYPDGLYFEIQRNDKPIGFHKATVKQDGPRLIIENLTVMKTRAFFNLIPYELEYRSASIWQNDRFIEYKADVLEQNEKLKISLRLQQDHSILRVNDEQQKVIGEVIPSPNWLSVYINGRGLLDGLTGEIENVSYAQAGTDTVRQIVKARRYDVLSKNIEATEWYDQKSRWVAMSFEAPDGSEVKYVCIICGLEESIQLSLNADYKVRGR